MCGIDGVHFLYEKKFSSKSNINIVLAMAEDETLVFLKRKISLKHPEQSEGVSINSRINRGMLPSTI